MLIDSFENALYPYLDFVGSLDTFDLPDLGVLRLDPFTPLHHRLKVLEVRLPKYTSTAGRTENGVSQDKAIPKRPTVSKGRCHQAFEKALTLIADSKMGAVPFGRDDQCA